MMTEMSRVADSHAWCVQGNIVVLDAGSRPGASKINTADDCCNACRQNSQVSASSACLSQGPIWAPGSVFLTEMSLCFSWAS